jgi:hypothetical protein
MMMPSISSQNGGSGLNMNNLSQLRQRLQQSLPTQSSVSTIAPSSPQQSSLPPSGRFADSFSGSVASSLRADAPLRSTAPAPLPEPREITQTAVAQPLDAGVNRTARATTKKPDSSETRASQQERPSVVPTPTPQRLPLAYQDIKRVAEASGFVDLSDQAIERAYRQGKSLMVDYKV